MSRSKTEIKEEYEKTVNKITKLYILIQKLENKLYSLAMEYRSYSLEEKKTDSETKARRWKDLYMND